MTLNTEIRIDVAEGDVANFAADVLALKYAQAFYGADVHAAYPQAVHLASLREPRLDEFPLGGGSNKLNVRLRIRNLAALPVLAETRGSAMGLSRSALGP